MPDVNWPEGWNIPLDEAYGSMFDVSKAYNENKMPEDAFTPDYRRNAYRETMEHMGAGPKRKSSTEEQYRRLLVKYFEQQGHLVPERYQSPADKAQIFVKSQRPKPRPWWVSMWDWLKKIDGAGESRTKAEKDTLTSRFGAPGNGEGHVRTQEGSEDRSLDADPAGATDGMAPNGGS